MVAVKRDDGAGRRGVGELVQDDGCLVWRRVAANQFAGDELVHVDIGLVQPKAACLLWGVAKGRQMGADVFDCQWADLFEHFAAFLLKQLVAVVKITVFRMLNEDKVVADVV